MPLTPGGFPVGNLQTFLSVLAIHFALAHRIFNDAPVVGQDRPERRRIGRNAQTPEQTQLNFRE
jgi:hypothetical protein